MSGWPTIPRWAQLPGDPPELRRWLAAWQAEATGSTDPDDNAPPPPEEPR